MKFIKFIASQMVVFSIAVIGSLATTSSIESWYQYLEKPVFNPPNWVFGPVWTILYFLIGISLYLIWVKKPTENKQRLYVLFGLQLILNLAWTLVFFGLKAILPALIIILLLLASITALIKLQRPISKVASMLFIPYLIWVGFATLLNASIWLLN